MHRHWVVLLLYVMVATACSHARLPTRPDDLRTPTAEPSSPEFQMPPFQGRSTSFFDEATVLDGLVCVKGSTTDDETTRNKAERKALAYEVEKRGFHKWESFSHSSSGSPPTQMIRVDGSQVFEYSVELKPKGLRDGMECYDATVALTSTKRDFDAERGRSGISPGSNGFPSQALPRPMAPSDPNWPRTLVGLTIADVEARLGKPDSQAKVEGRNVGVYIYKMWRGPDWFFGGKEGPLFVYFSMDTGKVIDAEYKAHYDIYGR